MNIFDILTSLWPLLLLFLFVVFISAIRGTSSLSFGYRQKNSLFTPAEIRFLKALTEAIGNQYQIFGKVRVADVLTPQKGLNKSHWQTAFNRIAMKHFDFVLCDPETLQVKYVIELDDKSHLSGKAKRRDAFLNDACESAGLTIIRVAVKREYDVGELREILGG